MVPLHLWETCFEGPCRGSLHFDCLPFGPIFKQLECHLQVQTLVLVLLANNLIPWWFLLNHCKALIVPLPTGSERDCNTDQFLLTALTTLDVKIWHNCKLVELCHACLRTGCRMPQWYMFSTFVTTFGFCLKVYFFSWCQFQMMGKVTKAPIFIC